MNKNFVLVTTTLLVALFLAACQSTPIDKTSKIVTPDRTIPANVPQDFIAPQAIVPLAVDINSGNLFDNGGFEDGLTGWTGCATGAIETSTDALEGSGALKLNPLNCFYRSAVVEAEQKIALSCNVKLLNGTGWTGMGMNFVDENFASLLAAPTTVTSNTSYSRIDTGGTAPTGTKFVSMWLYSENPVVVDNCSLMLEADPPPPPPPSGDNLLENGTFTSIDENSKPTDWSVGCGGSYEVVAGKLTLSNGACVDQGLSASDISALAGKDYTFSCAFIPTPFYADMTIFFDGVPTVKEITATTTERFKLSGTAPANATSGFVSVYSNGSLTVDDCVLEIVDPTTPPPNTDNFLENGTFGSADADNKPLEWSVGCGGDYTTFNVSPARKKLNLSNGACVDQSLSTNDIASLLGKDYVFSCEVSTTSAFSSFTVFFDGVATTKEVSADTIERIELFGTAPASATSAFVSIYSDGNWAVDNCELKVRASTPSDTVINFASSALAEDVRRTLGLGTTEDITESTILGLTRLDIGGRTSAVDSLEGLETAKNLTIFTASNVRLLTDLSPLASLSELTEVSILRSTITDLSPLASLTKLERLELRDMALPADSLNGLGTNLPNLTILNVSRLFGTPGNYDISVLANFTKLENLTALASGISDISSLANLPNIKDLELAGNPIGDLSPLVQNTNFATGDAINISQNSAIDLTEGSIDRQAMATLIARGVSVASDIAVEGQ